MVVTESSEKASLAQVVVVVMGTWSDANPEYVGCGPLRSTNNTESVAADVPPIDAAPLPSMVQSPAIP